MQDGVVSASTMDSVENMVDIGGEPTQVGVIGNSTNNYVSNVDLTMTGFLQRPIQIVAVAIPLDVDRDFSYNIWDLFLADPVVRSKLRNYAFLRCDLNVKIAISGTPFHYGKMLVSYQPFPSVNQPLNVFGPTFRVSRMKYLSQAPGAKTMDVRDNVPFEFKIPYVSPQPVARLFNNQSTALMDTQDFQDFTTLGQLNVSTLNQVKAVVATATSIYMYIYVYASDVSVFGSTGTLSVIETESDERKTGPVQRFATSTLGVSRAMESIPIIGSFAKASSIALGALKSMSTLFGWSYPVINVTPTRVKNEPFQNPANLIGCDTGMRITLDPKQELSVDPRMLGVSDDELVIQGICSRESYFDTFVWSPDDSPLVDLSWKCAVTPLAGKVDRSITHDVVLPTPLSFAAMPFEYWRGSITYRFEFVCSNFHRGKILFGYEPNVMQFGLISASLNVNKQYVRVVDLQETQSLEFTVEWNFPKSWAKNIDKNLIGDTVNDQYVQHSSDFESHNGIIFVTPFTALQSPDNSDISVNVYVRSDDMMFNRFSQRALTEFSGNPYDTESDTCCGSVPASDMEMSCCLLDPTYASLDHFGEKPISFRALLKRFMTGNMAYSGVPVSGVNIFVTDFKVLPTSNDTNNFVGSDLTLYQYLRWAFLAQRGGMRHRVLMNIDGPQQFVNDIFVSLFDDDVNTVTPGVIGQFGGVPSVKPSGTVIFRTHTNSGIEFETPCYTTNLFLWACNGDPWFNGPAMFQSEGLRNFSVNVGHSGDVSAISFRQLYATAEDFNLMRWISAYPMVSRTY
jgi:hypothetical protein